MTLDKLVAEIFNSDISESEMNRLADMASAVRAEALEEAAKICDARAEECSHVPGEFGAGIVTCAISCADHIRALKETP